MSILTNRVSQVFELFPKLSGLDALVPFNLQKKTENGFVELKPIGLIGEYIQPRDIIYFDLHFDEIWLDIEMALESRNRAYVITFELKVVLNSVRSEFENTLINLGIQSWAKIVSDDYYAFTELIVDYPHGLKPFNNSSTKITKQILSNNTLNNLISNSSLIDNIISFDFDSKLKCRLIFINISENISSQIEMAERSKSHSYSVKEIVPQKSCGINKHFENWLMNKTDSIAVYKQIIWRFQTEYDDVIIDDDNSSCSDESINLSIKSIIDIEVDKIDNRADSTGNFTNYCQKSPVNSPKIIRGKSFENHQIIQQTHFNTKYTDELSCIKTPIDYSLIVSKYASLYIPLKEFYRNSPDTRNLVELCNDIIETFEIESKDINTNYYKKDIWKGSERNRRKKWGWIIGSILLMVILYEFLL